MPDPDKPDENQLPVQAATGTKCTVSVPGLRIVVVVSFVCCMELADFEPMGALGAGRIYPLIMVMVNQPVDNINGSVTITRPEETTHTEMDGEKMTKGFHSELFADLNTPLPPANWAGFFSHYWIDPPAQKYVMIDPSLVAREIKDARAVNAPAPVVGFISKPINFQKLNGQAEFDNIHVAPKMIAPSEVLKNQVDPSFREIAMAPFCVHDCLHLHVRWGTGATGKQNLGWEGFTPYRKAGAPLVPPNQKVVLEILKPNSYRYNAEVQAKWGLKPGQWQVIMHHGGAYALSVTLIGKAAKLALTQMAHQFDAPIYGEDLGWAMFYWRLRYLCLGRKILERVEIKDMNKARS